MKVRDLRCAYSSNAHGLLVLISSFDAFDDAFDALLDVFDAFDERIIFCSARLLDMPTKIPETINSIVIQQWLQGVHRDTIAADNGISAGVATMIVNEWRTAVGFAKADELRELGTMLRRVGITPSQCALGFRVGMIMNRLGVKEDDFEPFILDVYNRCKDYGLSPEEVAERLKEMIEFTKANAIPLSQISGQIKQKAEEKNRLEGESQDIRAQIITLEEEIKESDNRRAFALYEEKMTSAQMKSYSDLMEELKSLGLPIDDISKFAKLVRGVGQKGYDVGKVIKEFSDLDSMSKDYLSYKDAIPALKMEYDKLNVECSSLEQTVNSHNQTLSVYNRAGDHRFWSEGFKTIVKHYSRDSICK